MKLPIYLYGHPVLRKQAQPITPDYPELKKFIADMFETMDNSDGVGLAAPQVGRADRIVVIDGNAVAEAYPECAGYRLALINPELEVLDGEEISRPEGCLSLPGINEDVKRVENIRLRWFDEDFNEHEQVMTGFLARIVQHELDHLEGEVFTDHISGIRRQLIRSKLNNIVTGKTRAEYPVRYADGKKR
ncbi:MAG: peptide deformylase [Muribaculaceae bacterium]|nr:peptide deformylase [Muribaculaceae bacterium]